ncbi:hypothetical protein GCM10020000_21780 [Streptomyces olivoverticillatus]
MAGLLMEYPCAAQPLLCRWFSDERLLQTVPDVRRVRPTVAAAAQALLHTHRRRAIDDLAEALVDAAHPRADELLAALAEDEPSALCRAVDRWAHDDRVERHVAAAAYGLKTAPPRHHHRRSRPAALRRARPPRTVRRERPARHRALPARTRPGDP